MLERNRSRYTTMQKWESQFREVSAFVVLDLDGNLVAKINVKHPRRDSTRLSCYLFLTGCKAQVAHDSSSGQNKTTSAMFKFKDIVFDAVGMQKLFIDLLDYGDWTKHINESNGFKLIRVI